MTDQEINVAIAEACGWVKHREIEDGHWIWVHPITKLICGQPLIPNYATDLNAMHEAEEILFGIQCENYARLLTGVGLLFYPAAHATARQRAEAFLRTIGKWKE